MRCDSEFEAAVDPHVVHILGKHDGPFASVPIEDPDCKTSGRHAAAERLTTGARTSIASPP